MHNINLVNNTISYEEIEGLIEWLKTNPRLTKGKLTVEFENRWSEWLGTKYSVFVNSGSSANLASVYSLKLSGLLKNNTAIAPAVSWVTTVSPMIQLGFDTVLCDCNMDNLGLDLNHLEYLIKKHNPSLLILVHVLGLSNDIIDIKNLCNKHGVCLVEDTCESTGSTFDNIKLGNFGDLSTFSFYYGHHISTIEGGMVCTNNEELYNILLSIRSHGWSRDLSDNKQKELQKQHNINDFRNLYTFYYPGFNLRSTDLQAFIGINQLSKLDCIIKNRYKNYKYYYNNIKNSLWKPKTNENVISNMGYPVIHNNIDDLTKSLFDNNIECRPLICGSIGQQPFWQNKYGIKNLPNANFIHNHGLYIPNNPDLREDEMDRVINVINSVKPKKCNTTI